MSSPVETPETPPSANKHLLRSIFDELEKGNGKPFVDAMAEDFSWTIRGRSAWSGTWRGKQAVRQELLQPLLARFADTYTNRALRFIAEGDLVAVECEGRVLAKSGRRYDNQYCWILRLREGRLVELTEYMDTELCLAALGAP